MPGAFVVAGSEGAVAVVEVVDVNAERAPLLAVRANGTKGWATLLWRRPDLLLIQAGLRPGTMSCRHYRYPLDTKPSVDVHTEGRPSSSREVVRTLAGQPLPDVATEILAAVGLTTPSYEADG